MLNFFLIIAGYAFAFIIGAVVSIELEDARCLWWTANFVVQSLPALGSLAAAIWGLILYKNRDFDICTDSFLHKSGNFLHVWMIIQWIFAGIFAILWGFGFWFMWMMEHMES